MENKTHTQFKALSVQRRFSSPTTQQPLRGVGQDKGAFSRERIASLQPAPQKKVMRAHQLDRNSSRSQNRPKPKRKTVHVTLWVKPVVKAELKRLAESEGVSVSKAGGAFLEKAIQTNIDMQYAALLQPVIQKAIAQQMRSYSTRIAVLLVRSLFASEQTRGIVTNILGRQEGVTPSVLNEILDGSSNTAKRNITRITPQLADLIKEVAQWMREEGRNQPSE